MLGYIALMLMQVAAPGTAPPRPIKQWIHTTWTAKDGGPTDINAIAQTKDGYLWIGTQWGVIRFDGTRFVPLAPQFGDTLATHGVRHMLATRDGSLWIAWGGGTVTRVRNGRLTTYGPKDGLPSTFKLAESSTGILVAGTEKGIAQFADGKWADVSRAWNFPGTGTRVVWFDHEDALWAATERSFVYRPAGASQFLDTGLSLAGLVVGSFAEARDGTVWTSAPVARTVPRVGDTRPPADLRAGRWLTADRKGSLWVGFYGGGLGRVADPRRASAPSTTAFSPQVEYFTMKDGLLSDIVNAVFEDREGSIWVGGTVGLERFREGDFTPVSTGYTARAQNVFATRDGSIWTATFPETSVRRLGPHGLTTVRTDHLIKGIAADTAGVPWTITAGSIGKLQGEQFRDIPLRGHDVLGMVSLTIDPSDVLWTFDERLGLRRLDHDSLSTVVPMNQIRFPGGQLFSDREGRIWIGQRDQVALYDHGRFQLLGKEQGVATGVVHGFLQDHTGHVWFAGGGGLARIDDDGRVRAIAARRLPAAVLFSPIEDADGAWWIATRLGVVRLPPGEADRALTDSTHVVQYRLFDTSDGLAGSMNLTSMEPVLARAADGRIWVAGSDGIASTDPRHLHSNDPPPVMIEALRIAGHEVLPSAQVDIPAASRDIEIDYTSTALATPERIVFRYRLEGEDPEWREVGARRRAYYSGIAPGTHRFRVSAKYGDGHWNETVAVWTLRVLPAWYQTLWFRAAGVLFIAVLGGAIATLAQRMRYRRGQAALKSQYDATLSERARIAHDLHDTLLQGFVGVTLQLQAAENALPLQPELAADGLRRAGQLARDSVREARERVWEMHDTSLTADLPAALETIARDRTAGTGISLTMRVIGQRRALSRVCQDAALRIGREAIVNVTRHANARHMEIELTFTERAFTLEVRDDGCGFSLEQGDDAHRNGHFGLHGIRDRAADAGGTAEICARQGGGAVVRVALPIPGYAAR